MRHSVALTTAAHDALATHLLRPDGQEDLCFAVWLPSTGARRRSALIGQVLLPGRGDRDVHGNASFSSQYFLRAIAEARAVGGGVALLHSHPGGRGWQGMSQPDIDTERRHAPRAYSATGLPFLGMTVTGDRAWSARFWERKGRQEYERQPCVNTRVVGQRLEATWDDTLAPPPPLTDGQMRTVSAWGDRIQQSWTRLRIAIVGTGSVGSLIAEALARSGATELVLIDFDSVEAINLDRLLHATARDAALARAKVEVLRRALRRSATAARPTFATHELSVVEPGGLEAALDCDVIFSCVDRPWPRAALNYVAFAHLIPVVDVGSPYARLATATCVSPTGVRASRSQDARASPVPASTTPHTSPSSATARSTIPATSSNCRTIARSEPARTSSGSRLAPPPSPSPSSSR